MCLVVQGIVEKQADIFHVTPMSSDQIKKAMVFILKNRSYKKVIELGEDIVDISTAVGAVRIFEN